MTVCRNTIYLSAVFTLAMLVVCFLLEFKISDAYIHKGFWLTISTGILVSAILILATSAIQYLRHKKSYFFKINRNMQSIQRCMSSKDLLSDNHLQYNINEFKRTYKERNEITDYLNDFRMLKSSGKIQCHICSINKIMSYGKFHFWADLDKATTDEEYLSAFKKANDKYKAIESDFNEITRNFEKYLEKKTKNPFVKTIG